MLRWKYIQVPTLCVLLIGGGCSSDGPERSTDQPQVAVSVEDALISGVGVIALGCGPSPSTGSGVAMGASGQVVTVAHTVAGATSIRVVDAHGTEYEASVAALDPDADLAVLTVDGFEAPPLPVGEVQLGDGTLIRWSAEGGLSSREVDVTQRLAITINDIYGTASVERSGFEFTGDVVVGDSGGPVISADGAVIGIVYARSTSRASTAFATDATEISAVLGSARGQPVDVGACV